MFLKWSYFHINKLRSINSYHFDDVENIDFVVHIHLIDTDIGGDENTTSTVAVAESTKSVFNILKRNLNLL